MKYKLTTAGILSLAFFFTACKKETKPVTEGPLSASAAPTGWIAAIKSNISANWDADATGSYTESEAEADLGDITGWNQSRVNIASGKSGNGVQVTLLPNALSGDGGVIANVDISDGTAYELDFDVKFHSQFDFSRGGKIGFGFLVGEGNTGGDPGTDGNGGSLRMMWYASSADRVFFQPYVYYKDQPEQYGDEFTKRYPASGTLQKGTWYHVHMYIKSNTGSSTNGHAQILVNNTAILDQAIRWTTNDSQRLIKRLSFHTFRGGSQSYWESSTQGYIYYDNLVVRKIS